ncbi:MAG: phytoene/squalene synthase family protein [Nocardioidaceae bacterium]
MALTSNLAIESAYDQCEAITRREARNFSYGIRLLPAAKRRALSAVYAMARRIDDIGDGSMPIDAKRRSLTELRAFLSEIDSHPEDPVALALSDVTNRFPLPMECFGEIIDGCEADLSVHRYETFDELVGYCRYVAGSVGRLSVGVYDPSDLRSAMPLADDLGIALQITNILRDLREDRLVERVYVPQEDLNRFGCTLDVDEEGRLRDDPERFAALVRFEADRADRWYERGLALLPLLDRRSAACTAAMAGIYRRLLRQIALDPEPVRSGRLSLSGRAKIAVAARALIGGSP